MCTFRVAQMPMREVLFTTALSRAYILYEKVARVYRKISGFR